MRQRLITSLERVAVIECQSYVLIILLPSMSTSVASLVADSKRVAQCYQMSTSLFFGEDGLGKDLFRGLHQQDEA